MSGRLCKYAEGAGSPLQVKALEDGVNDSFHSLHIYKTNHGTGPGHTSTKRRSMILVVRSFLQR